MSVLRKELREVRVLANGGMATIILGQDGAGREVVIRELHRRHIFNFRVHRGFRRGMRVRQRLCPHDNIVCPLARGYRGLAPYELIEYLPDGNLRELISRKNERVQRNSLEILRQIATGLTHMHNQGILHLDVKPENVLIAFGAGESDVQAKLTDFDLSMRLRGDRTHSRAGTASHMAPEQLTSGQVSSANDIFAFGIMAYYLVTGKMPFSGFSLDEVRRQQVSRNFEVVEPRKHNADIAPKLNWLILRCLEKNQHERFPHMAYLLQELGRV